MKRKQSVDGIFTELLAAMDEIATKVYHPRRDGAALAACRAENRQIIEILRSVHQRDSRTRRPTPKLAA